MPTYDYECKQCGYTFEVFHAIAESYNKKCPKCSGRVQKLISGGSGLIFKGNGFYATDYKKKPGTAVKKNKNTESASNSDSPGQCAASESPKCSECKSNPKNKKDK